MIRERGEPAIADTSKPIIEPPVFPDYPTNTQQTRPVAEDPSLVGGNGDDDDEDLVDEEIDDEEIDDEEAVADEFDADIDDREVVIEDGDEIIDPDDDEDDI